MLLDNHRLTCQVFHLGVSDAEAVAVFLLHLHCFNEFTFTGLGVVDHLDGLAAQIATQDGRPTGFESRLVYVEFIRVYSTLNDGLTQTVRGSYKYHVTEAGFCVEGEHNATGRRLTAHHFLDTS